MADRAHAQVRDVDGSLTHSAPLRHFVTSDGAPVALILLPPIYYIILPEITDIALMSSRSVFKSHSGHLTSSYCTRDGGHKVATASDSPVSPHATQQPLQLKAKEKHSPSVSATPSISSYKMSTPTLKKTDNINLCSSDTPQAFKLNEKYDT